MSKNNKVLGVIVAVDGDIAQVGMFSMSNDSQYVWQGDIINGPKVGALLTIHQNEIKIIASVSSEKIIDNQNTVKSTEFDNRYRKDSINRTVYLKTKGVIEESLFLITSQYIPMIGNEVTLTSQEELDVIYSVDNVEESIIIGKSLLENQIIRLPINNFFASHIGIFGNTGSGKSNTLHKLYLELFRSKYYCSIIEKSLFFIIDFNGEYIGENMFGVKDVSKIIYSPNTKVETGNKIPVQRDHIFNADILTVLFDARPATQVPFLRNSLRVFEQQISDGESFAEMEIGLLNKILTGGKDVSSDALNNWISAAKELGIDIKVLEVIEGLYNHTSYGNHCVYINDVSIVKDGQLTEEGKRELKIDDIKQKIIVLFNQSSPINQLRTFLEFQKVYVSAWKSTNIEHINPLFKRIESAFRSLEKVVDVVDKIENKFKALTIISLVNVNQEMKRILPMLLSKMIYDNQKQDFSNGDVSKTIHLIIDEAHNILNSEFKNVGDDWQDYRLSVFEEIIKEGRKFGVYLTLSSQRPSDISPTILSQAHNYVIHRLVNEKDLKILENTMSTLDKSSFLMIPKLGQGECILTGTAMNLPISAKIKKEDKIRPKSDDIKLTKLWNEKN